MSTVSDTAPEKTETVTATPAGGTGIDTSIGTDTDIPSADEIPALRQEIDRLDAQILELIKQRTAVSRKIGRARMASGGPRIAYSREMAVLNRFSELGEQGRELGMLLLRLGRGRLGAR
ncbi:chorismate mutase [Pseudonocardia thermophila]|jgi:monofunctional chorismate mutase, high GC gram positive type|uniref:Chorismate mutase n=1 Tax=Pseudonocardia thermophila TaxID=1848 RepID=A0A1M7ABD7_PSETH|nr:chorismate mutase [Pseudonocardia thermophila]SHL40061.1 chorismate mutase [Pseudonocardia thermophila]